MKNYRRRKRCLKYSKPGRRLSRSTPSDGIYSCHVNSAITVLPPSGCHQFFLCTRWKINQRHSVLHSICRGKEVPCWREALFRTVSLDTRGSSGFAGYCFVLHATTLSLTKCSPKFSACSTLELTSSDDITGGLWQLVASQTLTWPSSG